MKNLHIAVIFFCSTVFSTNTFCSNLFDGIIKDDTNTPVSGVIVTLVSQPLLRDTSGTDGKFAIGTGTGIMPHSRTAPYAPTLSIRHHKLWVSFGKTPANASLSLFSCNGELRYRYQFMTPNAGVHVVTLPHLAPGLYAAKLDVDKLSTTQTIACTGKSLLSAPAIKGSLHSSHNSAVSTSATIDTLMFSKAGFKPLKEPVTATTPSGFTVILDRTASAPVNVKDLPTIRELPDPLTMNNGTKVTTAEQWKLRRKEMIRILENYEYGHMPPPPGNFTATIATATKRITVNTKLSADYRMMRLSFGSEEKLGFDLGIFTPIDSGSTKKQFPVLISVDYSAGEKSLGASSAALSRGYAVATIPYQQCGADAANYKSTGFFPSYPDYDWRDFSAWAWGVSRAIDYLITDSMIDKNKIMVTGTSRTGQAALLAGAFDERIALTAPVAGGMAFRFSGKEMGGGIGQGITEIVDQNTIWFGPLFEKFRNQTPKLPCDQHWLPALTAPRLFIMCNSLKDEYGRAYAAVQSYLGAKPVYEFLGVTENIGLNFRAGGHGMNAEDWSALLDFADQKLLKKAGDRKFNVIPPKDQTP